MSEERPVVPIDGDCDPRFERVREAFSDNFRDGSEIGAAVCIHVEGRAVVDLWGGHRDRARSDPWQRDTLVNAYSVGKGILAILFTAIVEQGLIDLEARVADVWPEFGAAGKHDVTLRQLLSHQTGLPAVREVLPPDAIYDWDRMASALASQAPYWAPGSGHGYHVNTLGFLVGEVIRRATGLSVGEALAHYVAGPAECDFYYGLPRKLHRRAAEVVTYDEPLTNKDQWAVAFPPTGDPEHDAMIWHAYFNPAGASGIGTVNTTSWRDAAIPSTNGHASARGVAGIYSAYLDGGPAGGGWAGRTLRAEACRIQADGQDIILSRPSRFGLGFQLPQPERPIGPNAATFGHYGFGGSLGFGDPDGQVAFGYLLNCPGPRWQSDRNRHLIDALYDCL
jgi:CubicO group peptidase (beta-lactamase class C family)